jgi:hypothetical protein
MGADGSPAAVSSKSLLWLRFSSSPRDVDLENR